MEGKDVVARAKTGSGKTFAYLLPLLQKLFTDSGSKNKLAPSAFVLVPTRELSQQVYTEVSSLIELCRVQLKVVQLMSSMTASDLRAALVGPPNILVCTPACIPKCFTADVLQSASINSSLEILVLDEADLLLSYGYEDDIKAFTAHIPRRCQCLLMSATSSADVEKLKKLILHNPFILTLPEVGNIKDEVIPKNVQQFWFGIKSAVLNAELPQNSRLHILEEFNAGLFDYLIATDDSQTKEKEETNRESNAERRKSRKHAKHKLDSEFGVVRGIDFKNVHTVINFEMPESAAGYVHRIGRTGRAYSTGASVSLVSPDEMEIFEEIKSVLGDDENKDSNLISPFSLLSKNAVESLRYRAEDIAKSVTKVAVKEARFQDLKKEILNSEKLKAHFEVNPRDLDLLKHDKALSKKPPAPHLRDVPDYLLDPKTQEASKLVKLSRAAMGNNKSMRREGSKKKFRKSKDPLKTFSAEAPKRARKGGIKSEGKGGDDSHKHKKKKSI
ncbi:hypothetical protein ACB098_02G148200 [Castanea mollissima]